MTLRGPATRSPADPACRVATTEPTVQIYLPIADLPVNVFVILAIGLAVGFISGMFGIGGGFLLTPLLIFLFLSPAGASGKRNRPIPASSLCRRGQYLPRPGPALSRAGP